LAASPCLITRTMPPSITNKTLYLFECEDDREAAQALFDAAADGARAA
jgi:hypothetical protein